MAKTIPVYLFIGFLEGGKTHVIQESLENEKFNNGEKTLIIQCEEGVDELDFSKFYSRNCYLSQIENEEDLTLEKLTELGKAHIIDRIMIEYNGMWTLDKLFGAMPQGWVIYQCMMFADANTFLAYNANMRQLMFDKISNAEAVILTRTPDGIDKEEVHRVVRAISKRASIAYDYPDGHVEYDEIEDPLPFDVEAPVIDIADEDYAIWYRDMTDDMQKYDGKTVRFTGVIAQDKKLADNEMAIGRHVMTCCEADIAYTALICTFPRPMPYKTRDWVKMTAKIKLEKKRLYNNRLGPVLYVIDSAYTAQPDPEVATFY